MLFVAKLLTYAFSLIAFYASILIKKESNETDADALKARRIVAGVGVVLALIFVALLITTGYKDFIGELICVPLLILWQAAFNYIDREKSKKKVKS